MTGLTILAAHYQVYASATDPTAATADLNPFLMITFADLKKYKYYYWCCFPALLLKGWQVEGEWTGLESFNSNEVCGWAGRIMAVRAVVRDWGLTSVGSRWIDRRSEAGCHQLERWIRPS